jgi:formiminoglutamase
MNYFRFSTKESITALVDPNLKGQKLGEKVTTVNHLTELENSDAKFVVFGVPTPILSKETLEFSSASHYESTLTNLLNTQHNEFNRGDQLVILGEVVQDSIEEKLSQLKTNSEKIKFYYEHIDIIIYEIIFKIVASGKLPILIGGGNRCLNGLLKAIEAAQRAKANVLDLSTQVNIELKVPQEDEIHDLYKPEFLNKQHSFGLHINYISDDELKAVKSIKALNYYFYDDCLHLTTLDKCIRFKNAVDFLKRTLGFKLDLASIQGMSSKPDSSSGFSVRDIRTFIKIIRKEKAQFFHITGLETEKLEHQSQLLSYLITDFIRNDD